MAKSQLPSADMLRKLVSYDPDTGLFTWLRRPDEMFRDAGAARAWNTRYAGRPALANHETEGYRQGKVCDFNVKAHRAAWAVHYGQWPDGDIDHINHDRADNRIANLRCVPRRINARNCKKSAANTSGVTGVAWVARLSKWQARIGLNGKMVSLGCYGSRDEAVAARKAAEGKHGFHENHGA